MNTYGTFSKAYPYIIKDILENGAPAAPRGIPIKELCGYSFKLNSIDDPLPLQESRKLNYKFGVLEGLLNVAGIYPRAIVLKFNKQLGKYINTDTGTWDGAYAPRLDCTIQSVFDLLKKDPDTRQAVMPIFQIQDINRAQISKDVPCTISLQFLIRDGKLNTIATMRSNDILWGTAYDVNQFTTITRVLASCLGIEAGWYIHQAGSMHSYDEREHLLKEIVVNEVEGDEGYADFLHPHWGHQDLAVVRDTLRDMFNKIELSILNPNYRIQNTFAEPYRTYFDYLSGVRPVTYAKNS